jgi:hypothetical protein
MSQLVVHVETSVRQGTLALTGFVHVFPVRHPATADALTQDLTLITVESAEFHVIYPRDNSAVMEHASAPRAT